MTSVGKPSASDVRTADPAAATGRASRVPISPTCAPGGEGARRSTLSMLPTLSESPPAPYHQGMDSVPLPPELEQFATEAVAAGRYHNVAEVVAAGVRLLQQAEAEMATFVRSLEEAQAEGKRDGFLPAEQVHGEMRAMLDEMAHAQT